jgi:hypothetical protein
MSSNPQPESKGTRKLLVATSVSELIGSLTVLRELREGRTARAVELLEFMVDCQLSALAARLRDSDPACRRLAMPAVKQAKAYRRQHPRTPQASVLATDELSAEDVEDAARDAETFLRDVA